jgi:penicillin-binding protein A
VRKNNLRKNISTLLIIFIVMFAGLILYLGYVDVVYGERWYATPYNPRIQNMKTNVEAGDILDRAGKKLLYTQNGKRAYIKDKSTRLSIAHIIGDEYGFSNGAQITFSKYLYGTGSNSISEMTQLLSGDKIKGSNIALTIDAGLCDTAASALGGSNGAIVVMNYKTGEILASTSSPSFDPSDMSRFEKGGGTSELVNRAFSGLYPPGSTFKLITAAALIENGKDGFITVCTGSTEIGGQDIDCTGEHGAVDLKEAITHSCNVYFAEAAQQLGAAALKSEAEKFLYNKSLLFDDIITGTSVFESGNNDTNESWAAIGQYHDLVTPVHACMIAACIANNGVMMEPKLLISASNDSGQSYKLKPEVNATPLSNTDALKEMMVSVVKSGTGKAAAIKGYTVAGKTGTAQVQNIDGSIYDDAWFVGFIEDDGHPIAIAVVMEEAGSGGSKAAPAAQKVLKKALSLGY